MDFVLLLKNALSKLPFYEMNFRERWCMFTQFRKMHVGNAGPAFRLQSSASQTFNSVCMQV